MSGPSPRTADVPPSVPADPVPASDAVGVPVRPLLKWAAAQCASSYDVLLWPAHRSYPLRLARHVDHSSGVTIFIKLLHEFLSELYLLFLTQTVSALHRQERQVPRPRKRSRRPAMRERRAGGGEGARDAGAKRGARRGSGRSAGLARGGLGAPAQESRFRGRATLVSRRRARRRPRPEVDLRRVFFYNAACLLEDGSPPAVLGQALRGHRPATLAMGGSLGTSYQRTWSAA